MSATGLIVGAGLLWALLQGKKKSEATSPVPEVVPPGTPIEPPSEPAKPPGGGGASAPKACVYTVLASNKTSTFPSEYKNAKDLAVQDAVMVNAALAGGIAGVYKAPWVLTRECGGVIVELKRVNKGEGTGTVEGMVGPASGGWQGGTTVVIEPE